MGLSKDELDKMEKVYAIGEESAFTVMALKLQQGAEMQGLSWDIIQDKIATVEFTDEDGYHCIFHYMGTPLVFFTVPDNEEGMILISHPSEPGQKLSDELLS